MKSALRHARTAVTAATSFLDYLSGDSRKQSQKKMFISSIRPSIRYFLHAKRLKTVAA
jgi:hypothetical protein